MSKSTKTNKSTPKKSGIVKGERRDKAANGRIVPPTTKSKPSSPSSKKK